ncbi:hypothetical protein [Ferrimonas sp.]|uniref:hypothetical protein n=1 Tax=Ferrimonas sp. TaxID=2080861 RepID=UPI003A93FC89
MNSRYRDPGYPLRYWATQVEVNCPKCDCVALIKGNPDIRAWHATLFCPHCAHTLKTGKSHWQGPVAGFGSRPCQRCGFQSVHCNLAFESASQVSSPVGHAPCPNCQTDNAIELSFTRSAPADHAIDPYFGLELALKEPTRHGVVWVYGAAHLKALKAYIQASLREGSGLKWAYFTRLPTWIKSGKNREEVLKAIARLERRAVSQANPEDQ